MSSSAAEQNATLVRSLLEMLNEGGSKAVLARVEEFGDPEIEWRGIVYRFREGRIIRGENFASHSEATESAQRRAAGARR